MNEKVLPFPLGLLLVLLALYSPVQLVGLLPPRDIDDLLLHFGPPESLIKLVLGHKVADFSVQVILLCLILYELSYIIIRKVALTCEFFVDFLIVNFFLCGFLLGTATQVVKVRGRHVRVL